MGKHHFIIGVSDENSVVRGAQCSKCSVIALYVNGKVPDDIHNEECPAKSEDINQAASQIVREATEKY